MAPTPNHHRFEAILYVVLYYYVFIIGNSFLEKSSQKNILENSAAKNKNCNMLFKDLPRFAGRVHGPPRLKGPKVAFCFLSFQPLVPPFVLPPTLMFEYIYTVITKMPLQNYLSSGFISVNNRIFPTLTLKKTLLQFLRFLGKMPWANMEIWVKPTMLT